MQSRWSSYICSIRTKAIAVSEMTSLVSCSVSRHPMARRLLCPPKRFSEIGLGNLPKSFVHQDNHIPASSTKIKRLTGFPAGFFLPVRDTVRKFYPYY